MFSLELPSFDETIQGANIGIEAVYTSSLSLNAKAKLQNATVKMLALIPTSKKLPPSDKNAASKRLAKEDIKERELEVHHRCIGVLVRELNKFSLVGGGGRCSMSGREYLFDESYHAVHMAMDHPATEQHGLKASKLIQSLSFV